MLPLIACAYNIYCLYVFAIAGAAKNPIKNRGGQGEEDQAGWNPNRVVNSIDAPD